MALTGECLNYFGKGLIERAQFALNPKMYERGGFKELRDQGFEGTWLEWFLKETETFHGEFFSCSH